MRSMLVPVVAVLITSLMPHIAQAASQGEKTKGNCCAKGKAIQRDNGKGALAICS
jgi:hypothetical protein